MRRLALLLAGFVVALGPVAGASLPAAAGNDYDVIVDNGGIMDAYSCWVLAACDSPQLVSTEPYGFQVGSGCAVVSLQSNQPTQTTTCSGGWSGTFTGVTCGTLLMSNQRGQLVEAGGETYNLFNLAVITVDGLGTVTTNGTDGDADDTGSVEAAFAGVINIFPSGGEVSYGLPTSQAAYCMNIIDVTFAMVGNV